MATADDVSDASPSAAQLESALNHGEFELYYQPLIDVRDHSMHGVEALIRWNHPTHGLLNPAEFITLAEDTGAVVPMGHWTLRQACIDHRRLRQIARTDLLLSVNVSARQLEEPTFVSELAGILRETGIVPRLLQLEITESIFLKDSLRIGALFHAIRALGVRIAFDDFGTGCSSLSYLSAYPIDLVKIDRYFVQRMSKSYVHTEVVQLIVDLARTFGLSISAEGVEDRAQAEALRQLGCNIAQGYLYSPPLPLASLTEMLDETREQLPKRPPQRAGARPTRVRSLLGACRDSVRKYFTATPQHRHVAGYPSTRSAALRSGPD
jgi:EAL domain-containing protein (putative c-di-GMP-specific phosphodiesterase class I)